VADFVAGTDARPSLPGELEEHLTTTVDGLWVVWAHKLARQAGDLFVPLTGGSGYPADARAECRFRGARGAHSAPDGRHAVVPAAPPRDPGPMRLNLPVSCPVLLMCHDDAGWYVGSGTSEHSPESLVLT
jgi:hypothetical protein